MLVLDYILGERLSVGFSFATVCNHNFTESVGKIILSNIIGVYS